MTASLEISSLIEGLPARMHRKDLAKAIRERLGVEYSPRTIESWGLPVVLIAGRAYLSTDESFRFVLAKIAAAESIAA